MNSEHAYYRQALSIPEPDLEAVRRAAKQKISEPARTKSPARRLEPVLGAVCAAPVICTFVPRSAPLS